MDRVSRAAKPLQKSYVDRPEIEHLQCQRCGKRFRFFIAIELRETIETKLASGTVYASAIICPICKCKSGERLVSFIPKNQMSRSQLEELK